MTMLVSDHEARHVLPRTLQLLEHGVDSGLHLGAQVYVSHERRVLVDCAVGESSRGVPLQPRDVMLWLSSGKPLLACAVLQLVARHGLALGDTIAEHIPEFAAGGKQDITIWNCLTHTAGFRHLDHGWPTTPWDEIIERICRTPLEPDWVPGLRAGYHVASSWFILAELLHRLEGRPVDRVIREDVCRTAGMRDAFSGMNRDEFHERQGRLAPIYNTWRGRCDQLPWHDEQHCCSPAPGGNSRGPAADLGRFYESLLQDRDGRESRTLLAADTVRLMTHRHRRGLYDETFQQVIDMGLGVILDSRQYGQPVVPYGYGPHCSHETFGHGGNQSSIGFADPEAQLVVVIMTNGMPGEPRHAQRNWSLTQAVYEDVFGVSAD